MEREKVHGAFAQLLLYCRNVGNAWFCCTLRGFAASGVALLLHTAWFELQVAWHCCILELLQVAWLRCTLRGFAASGVALLLHTAWFELQVAWRRCVLRGLDVGSWRQGALAAMTRLEIGDWRLETGGWGRGAVAQEAGDLRLETEDWMREAGGVALCLL